MYIHLVCTNKINKHNFENRATINRGIIFQSGVALFDPLGVRGLRGIVSRESTSALPPKEKMSKPYFLQSINYIQEKPNVLPR
jgi:hypothetical protein